MLLVDVVTARSASLHDEFATLVAAPSLRMREGTSLYASSWRPVTRQGPAGFTPEIEVWAHAFEIGDDLPTLPSRLQGDVVIPVELQATYEEACRRRRIPLE